jgi:hypothetical protein
MNSAYSLSSCEDFLAVGQIAIQVSPVIIDLVAVSLICVIS